VFLAVADGTWILPRCFGNARPLDLSFPRSMLHAQDSMASINDWMMKEAANKIDHKSAGIRPNKPPLFAPCGLSDDVPVNESNLDLILYLMYNFFIIFFNKRSPENGINALCHLFFRLAETLA
jgi:hypothetical protein